jgi:hypothetical protein
MVPADMATTPVQPPKNDLAAELEKKLSSIGAHEQSITSKALATELGLPFADLKALPIDPGALKLIAEPESRASGVALLQVKGPVAVAATLDPRTPEAQQVLGGLTERYPQLKVLIVSPETMGSIWQRYENIKTAEVFEVGAIRAKSIQDLKEGDLFPESQDT